MVYGTFKFSDGIRNFVLLQLGSEQWTAFVADSESKQDLFDYSFDSIEDAKHQILPKIDEMIFADPGLASIEKSGMILRNHKNHLLQVGAEFNTLGEVQAYLDDLEVRYLEPLISEMSAADKENYDSIRGGFEATFSRIFGLAF